MTRSLAPLVGALSAMLLACGSDKADTPATVAAPATSPPTTATAASSAATAATTSVTSGTSANAPTTAATTASPSLVTISVTVGTDSSPTRVEHVPLGSTVTLELTDPSAENQYHIHDYDLESEHLPAGTTARITFTADRAGTFEVESHETENVLVQLEVS